VSEEQNKVLSEQMTRSFSMQLNYEFCDTERGSEPREFYKDRVSKKNRLPVTPIIKALVAWHKKRGTPFQNEMPRQVVFNAAELQALKENR
jgi:hypothetical protein